MTGNGPVAAGITDANNIFNGNMSAVTGFSNLTLTSTVTKTGIKLTSNVQFSANVPVVFMKVLGYQTLPVTGYSKATASLPPYLDFYLTLDVSGSMGLPSTSTEAVRMQSINPDNFVQYPTGCTLACHFAPLKSACVDPRSRPRPLPLPPRPRIPSSTIRTMLAWAMRIRASVRARSRAWSARHRLPSIQSRSRLAGSDAFRPAGFAQHGS